jgi:3-dehydroquinate synthase
MYSQINVASKINNYEIKFQDNLELTENQIKIIDENVANNFPNLIDKNTLVVKCDEYLKSLNGIDKILNWLIDIKANISSDIAVFGGGVLQDAVGFCASIFCRGINYTLYPTTLLSQIDSCVGGKTSINYGDRKNILGTFYPPKKIIVSTKFLESLPHHDYCSGLGELFKFDILRNQLDKCLIKNLLIDKSKILDVIYDSLNYKISILHIDEFDKKERKYLNFGHTFGHALEITSNYQLSHGYAVVLGCLIALDVSNLVYNNNSGIDIEKAKIISEKILSETVKLNSEWFDFDLLMKCVMSDKKNTGYLNMILMKNGFPVIEKIDDPTIIKSILEKYK